MKALSNLDRRACLRGLATAGLASWSAGVATAADEKQRTIDAAHMSPQEILGALYAGNQRFVAGDLLTPHRNLMRLREVAERQQPFAAFLGCADSRVPIEIVFDQGFGDLFVTRIAGNVAATENIASLEFGTEVLGAKVLFVLGHTNCGAVAATLKRDMVPGQISSLFQHIRPAVRDCGQDMGLAIRNNVKLQAQILGEASPVIARRIARGELIIAGGVYDLASGKVERVDVDLG